MSLLGWLTLVFGVLQKLTPPAVLIGGVGWAVHRSTLGKSKRVYRREPAKGQQWLEARSTPLMLLVDAVVGGVVFASGVLVPSKEPDLLGNMLILLVLNFVWFEIWFYVTHRLLHTRTFYFLHKHHHVSRVPNPLTALSFSIGERLVFLIGIFGFTVLASRFVALPPLTLTIFWVVTQILNVWVHCNVELLPVRLQRSLIGRFIATPTFHAMHHARFDGHYGFATTCLDRWLGTVWPDYTAVHARARRGEGLVRLGEKVSPELSPSRGPIPLNEQPAPSPTGAK